MPKFTAKIRPFFNRLDVEIDVLFYAVDLTRPSGPPTVFTDRFWDTREGWTNYGVGLVQGSEKVYFGPAPTSPFGQAEGLADWWINGMDYNRWIAGGYSVTEPCITIGQGGAFDEGFSPGFDIGF